MNPPLLLLFVFSLNSMDAVANRKVEIREPSFSGSGCPKGSADVVIAKNAKRIDIVFDKFFVEADNSLGNVSAKKECDTSIRIKVPHGFSLAIERVKYNGINKLPFGSNAHLVGAHFFNHEQVAVVNKRFHGRTTSAFNVNSHVPYQGLAWTPCGEEALVTSRTQLSVVALRSLHPASVQVDDKLLRPGISYYLLWRSCSEQRLSTEQN